VRESRPSRIWSTLDSKRQQLMRRSEILAALTLPYLMTPEGHRPDEDGAANDWQSVGAQLVNNLSTRLMLTLFAPSRPFIRLDASPQVVQEATEAGLSEEQLKSVLASGERKAVKVLDQKALRPKLFEVIKHLIVMGNVLKILDEDGETMRALGLKNYVVKRNMQGEVHTCVIREQVLFDELDDDVRQLPQLQRYNQDDRTVCFYILIRKQGKKYRTEQWVEEHNLGPAYATTYAEEDLPYRVLTWTLPDEADYGIGMVGEYQGDFESLSTLSKAIIEGAVLASEYRWLANPGGVTRPEDFENSKNGATVPGMKDDLTLVQAAAEVASALQVQQAIAAEYINRLGRAFLLSSSVTRDAERVTAEEIRLLASELESGLGGAYSRLAVDLQRPLGRFLLKMVGLKIEGKDLIPTVVTGLDALSRNGDLDALRRFLDDVVKVGALPPEVTRRLKLDAIFLDLGTGHGVEAIKYIRGDAEVQQEIAQERAGNVAEATATAAGQAAATGETPNG